jgi:hypothetical protein
MTIALWLILPGAFGVLNRFWGGDPLWGWSGRRFAVAGSVVLGALLYATTRDVPLALSPIVWLAGRSLAFDLFGGSTTPRGWEQISGAFVRFMVPAICYILVFATMKEGFFFIPPLIIYAALAMVASWLYAVAVMEMAADGEEEDGSVNRLVELVHGGLYGGAIVLGFVLQGPIN